jgi:glycosyltransferase involved in cell wall biosynthesis/SAM-dependent methyltransferase
MGSSASATRKRIALFTPLPPARTGTADYAAALLPELKKHADIEIFERAPRRFEPERYQAVIYQIANNPYHAGIYEAALRYPGIVVLHETNLHDLIRGMTANDGDAYLREVVYELFGLEMEAIPGAEFELRGQQSRTFSMLRRLLDRSKACIVHSQHALAEVRRRGFEGPVRIVQHGAKSEKCDGAAYRSRLGIGPDQFVLGMFGYQRPDKNALECLSVFHALLGVQPACRMIIAGAAHPEVPIDLRIKELGIEQQVQILGFQPLEDLDGCIAACDVVLNLRWPTFGETSGIAVRAFGMGKTVVVSDSGSDRYWPDDICVKIPCDRYQEPVLLETLQWLVNEPECRGAIGAAAAQWVCENATWKHAARAYVDFALNRRGLPAKGCRDVTDAGYVGEYLVEWSPPGSEAGRYFEQHRHRLIRTLQLTPPGRGHDRILEMGCYLQITPALRQLLGYGEIRGCYLGNGATEVKAARSREGDFFECPVDLFDCERAPFPYPAEHFETVLCCELLEHLPRDPMQMLTEIHRILKPGGALLLTTPNIVSFRSVNAVLHGNHPGFYCRYPDPDNPSSGDSKHEREYTPLEVSKLLTGAGFVLERIETGPYGAAVIEETSWVRRLILSAGQSVALRDDCIFAVARKAAVPREFRPAWLYDSSPARLENS